MHTPADLFSDNLHWADETTAKDPAYFTRLAEGQNPGYLWIGCSDSRIVPNLVTGLAPGELFVHRNIANLTRPEDPAFLATLQYALEILRIPDIAVVGHTGCSGIRAALGPESPARGPLDQWLAPVRKIRDRHVAELGALPAQKKLERLCELNVLEQTDTIARTALARSAWQRGQPLTLHSWLYETGTGHLKTLRSPRTAAPPGT